MGKRPIKNLNNDQNIHPSIYPYIKDLTPEELDELKKRALRYAEKKESIEQKELKEATSFMLSNEKYAIENEYILETVVLDNFTELPASPEMLAGLYNFRGNVIPIFDLRKFFGIHSESITQLNRLIILSRGENIFSILVDSIEGIIHFDEEELTSDITTIEGLRRDFLKGVTSEGIIILNAKNIIEDKNLIINN